MPLPCQQWDDIHVVACMHVGIRGCEGAAYVEDRTGAVATRPWIRN